MCSQSVNVVYSSQQFYGLGAIISPLREKLGFLGNSAGKESACNSGDPGLVLGSGTSTGEGIGYPLQCPWASLVAQLVKNLSAVWETWVRSLAWEDPLKKGTATCSSVENDEGQMPCPKSPSL